MSIETVVARPAAKRSSRPWSRVLVRWLRRGHLYFGLFLLPWAVLYGVTAFLFNHPTVLSDAPMAHFAADAARGTPLESLPTPDEQAAAVVAQLNAAQRPATPYTLAGPARYSREFASATVKAEGQTVSMLIDVKSGGGTVRSAPIKEKEARPRAPFAVGPAASGTPPKAPRESRGAEGAKLDSPVPGRIKEAIPTILERAGFPAGELTAFNMPDLVFPVTAEGQTWTAVYSPIAGSITGAPAEPKPETELSVRRFLLRLHLAHGYPGEPDVRWYWAVLVDAMAFALVFWALTGLVMWWKIKATRKLGAAVLVVSALAATALAVGMHRMLTGG